MFTLSNLLWVGSVVVTYFLTKHNTKPTPTPVPVNPVPVNPTPNLPSLPDDLLPLLELLKQLLFKKQSVEAKVVLEDLLKHAEEKKVV